MAKQTEDFVFRAGDRVGAAAAEEDREFLEKCFVDTGIKSILVDCTKPDRIIVGRTGSGKSAILSTIGAEMPDAVQIAPEDLALQFLSQSTILRHLFDLGVNLDPFFRLLWKHVFVVELIKMRYGLKDEGSISKWQTALKSILPGNIRYKSAIEYLESWGKRFWLQTEYRVREITESLEGKLEAEAGLSDLISKAKIAGTATKTSESKTEVVSKCQQIVSSIQIRKIKDVMDLLEGEMLADSRRHFYILIDGLDTDWIDDALRYRMIRALIETVSEFRRVGHAKVLVAIRRDLLDGVIRKTRDAGFQEEKLEDKILTIRWTDEQLVSVANKRVNMLIRQRYQKANFDWRRVFPEKISGKSIEAFMLDRTMKRPRDVIAFLNECLSESAGSARVTRSKLLEAERNYSRKRFRSLGDEWLSEYPLLLDFALVLRNLPMRFSISSIPFKRIQAKSEEIAKNGLPEDAYEPDADPLSVIAVSGGYYSNSEDSSKIEMAYIFYKTGIVGIKPSSSLPWAWSYNSSSPYTVDTLTLETPLAMHPAFYTHLSINTKA